MIPLSVVVIWPAAVWLALWLHAPAVAAQEAAFRFPVPTDITKASDLVGRTVETRDGAELGKVQDYAVDLASGRIAYVVISVGSFLIDDSLIAVDPRALRQTAERGGPLVLEARPEQLHDAERFAADGWPLQADVLADAGIAAATGDEREPAAGQPARRGSATISDGTRTATLSAGERSIRVVEPPAPPAPPAGAGAAPFEQLDRDGDGSLDRAEIAHQLSRDDSFSAIDADGDGTVDRDEFDAWRGGGTTGDD